YRSTPVEPGRVVRRRVIRSKGRQVLGVEDDLMRPELAARLDGQPPAVGGAGARMAAPAQPRRPPLPHPASAGSAGGSGSPCCR
ncbi:hypothetical protein CLM83_20540, partial [Streptomyces albidoflavus]